MSPRANKIIAHELEFCTGSAGATGERAYGQTCVGVSAGGEDLVVADEVSNDRHSKDTHPTHNSQLPGKSTRIAWRTDG